MMRRWLSNPLYLLCLLSSLVPLLLVGRYIQAYQQRVARLDQWHNSLNLAMQLENGTFDPGDLFIMNSGHWHVPNHIAIAVLTALTDWNTGLETWLNMALALLNFAMLVYLFYRHSPDLTPFAMIPIALMVFALRQERNWHFAYFGMWHYVNVFYLLALVTLFSRPPGWTPLLLAILFTQLANLSLGTAATLWVVLAVTLWLYGYRHWQHFAAWGVVGAIMFALYLTNAQQYMSRNYPDFEAPIEPLKSAQFLMAYLGGAFVREDFTLAYVVAVAGLILLTLNLFYRWYTQGWQAIALWFTLAGFALSSGAAISFRRIDSGLIRAFNDRYVASSMMLWISLFCLMILNTAYIYRQRERRGWTMALVNVNLLAALIFAGLYLQVNLVSIQRDALRFNYNIQDRGTGYTAYEQCILTYPIDRNLTNPCMETPILFDNLQVDERIYMLANYRLNLFAEQPQVNLLPETYEIGSPIILNTPNPWLNLYVRETLLHGLPESSFFHIAPPAVMANPAQFPRPLEQRVQAVDADTLSHMTGFIDVSDQVWYISTPERQADDQAIFDHLTQLGYVATPYPIQDQRYRQAQFSFYRFQQPPSDTSAIFTFGEEGITLQSWSITQGDLSLNGRGDSRVAPTEAGIAPAEDVSFSACENLRVQTWWQSEAVPLLNYSTTMVLVAHDGQMVAQKDAAIGDTLMQLWQPEQFTFDERLLTLPCDLPPGDYRLEVGLYHFAEGVFDHLPISDVTGDRALITTVRVE